MHITVNSSRLPHVGFTRPFSASAKSKVGGPTASFSGLSTVQYVSAKWEKMEAEEILLCMIEIEILKGGRGSPF